MNEPIKSVDPTDRIWNFFASVKLSVVLLLTLALTSIIGTLIPQHKESAQYIQQYGETWHRIFGTLNFYDMYGSWWFQLLLALLIVNTIVCSIDRLSGTWKVIFPGKPVYKSDRFRKSQYRRSFSDSRNPEDLKDAISRFMEKRFRHSRVEPSENGFRVYGEKGRWTRIGAYIIHMSVLLLVLGMLISSMFGYEGRMNLPVGETDSTMILRHSDARVQLDFSLRCDDFSITHYPGSGRVQEYRSEIAIIQDGEEVRNHSLIVNDPIRFGGYSIYQSTYGRIPEDSFTLVFTEAASGLETRKKAEKGEEVPLPGGRGQIIIQDYSNNFNFRGHNLGPTYLAMMEPADESPRPVILPVEHPNFDRMRQGEFVVRLDNIDYRYFTGLQIARDPGIPIVFSSFVIMILGFFITFYLAHRQVCIEAVRKEGGETEISVSGIAANRRPGINMTVKRTAEGIERILKQHNT